MEAAEHQRGHLLHRVVGHARPTGEVGEWRERHARAAAPRRHELPAPVDGEVTKLLRISEFAIRPVKLTKVSR